MQEEDSGKILGKRSLESPFMCNENDKPAKISCCTSLAESRIPLMTVVCTGETKLQLGQPWKFEISVTVTDSENLGENNSVRHLLENESDISISGDGLWLENCTKKISPEGIVVIGGVTFNEGPAGPKDLFIQWKDQTQCVTFELVTDTEKHVLQECDDVTNHSQTDNIEPHECNQITNCPFSLSFMHFDENKVVTMKSSHYLKHPLIVQLVGRGGQPLRESGVTIDLCFSEEPQVHQCLAGTLSNSNGQVIFGKLKISTKSQCIVESCPAKLCSNGCFGMFTIFAKAYYLEHIITGPKLHIHIEFNPSRPKLLKVDCNNIVDYTAGSDLEEYKVCIVAEDNSIISTVIAAHVTMKILPSGKTVLNTSYSALPYVDKSQKGFFFFRNRKAPTKCGQYGIQFVYSSFNCNISSEVLQINVLPGKPAIMTSSWPVSTPAVSNSKDISSRVIVEQLKLELRDIYNNFAGASLNAQLSIDIRSQDDSSVTPIFVGGITNMIVPFVNGEVLFPAILLEENCPGVDGHVYLLYFEVIGDDFLKDVLRYEIPFYFYHDMNKSKMIAKLKEEREAVLPSAKAYRELFETNEDLLKALQENVKRLVAEELISRTKLKEFGLLDKSLTSLSDVSAILQDKYSKRAEIWRNRRSWYPPPLVNDALVVGKVGHLACVPNKRIAKVLSWHLADKMQCMVMHTTEKALEIHHKTGGTRQVLALDLFNHDAALNVWNRPLPHTELPNNFQPTGHPVAARDQLTLTCNVDTCKVVFGILLGETILIDTLEDGILYRREIVKHASCPTILTRDGHRIQSDGSFSGPENKYSSSVIKKSNGLVFLVSLPYEENNLVEVIGLLQRLQQTMEQQVAANAELEKYQQQNASSDMSTKLEEYQKMEMRLKNIDSQLESLSRHSALSEDVISNCILAVTTPAAKETVNSAINSKSNVAEIVELDAANDGELVGNCAAISPDYVITSDNVQ